MAANTFPEDWRDQPCFLVTVPRPLVQYVAGLLKIAENRGFWASEADYLRGYTAITEWEGCLMTACLDTLFQKQDELYRLVNTALLGVAYTTVTEDPLVITPGIAPHVNLDIHDEDSVLGRLDRLNKLVDNTFNGTANDQYSYTPSVKDQLQAIIDAIGSGDTDLTEVIADLEGIAVLLA